MATYHGRNGPASKGLALDLVLRTFMNSSAFNISNNRMWESISRLVPGTTPQQCAQRWEELALQSRDAILVGDLSGLAATGRPISSSNLGQRRAKKNNHSVLNSVKSFSELERGSGGQDWSRPHSVMWDRLDRSQKGGGEAGLRRSISHCTSAEHAVKRKQIGVVGDESRGTFVATFCQNVLNKPKESSTIQGDISCSEREKTVEREKTTERKEEYSSEDTAGTVEEEEEASKNSSKKAKSLKPPTKITLKSDIIIHVFDDAKKTKKDFCCPRDVVMREMRFLVDYYSPRFQLVDILDISIHCNVQIFGWLMQYAKRGMLSGPSGEVLTEPLQPPTLKGEKDPVTILVSANFLMMDSLVEECLEFFHEDISLFIDSTTGLSSEHKKLMTRLAAKFTPLEAERVADPRDKIRSKLFLYQLEQLFQPTYSSEYCPANAATLYLCRHCNKLLTVEQESLLPCADHRLSVAALGDVKYCHERSNAWNINTYIQNLQQCNGLSPRDIYWRLWGLVNTLVCEACGRCFQCCDLAQCSYHSGTEITPLDKTPYYLCCKQPTVKFSILPHHKKGCCFKDHWVSDDKSQQVYSTLLEMREAVCSHKFKHSNTDTTTTSSSAESPTHNTENKSLLCLLENEYRKPKHLLPSTQDTLNTTTHLHGDPSPLLSPTHASSSTTAPTTRQLSHEPTQDHSDLEEDEEGASGGRVVGAGHQRTLSKGGKKKATSIRAKKHDSKGPGQVGDWIWNQKKSRRWNQDMQRESDERRQRQLTTQLSHLTITANSNSSSSKNKEVSYAGGIFSKLETQFRDKQTAAMQSSQQQRSLKKRAF